ncbi:MAG: histidine phosphatase family protein [Candidatus Krumholzibacteria bacterium]|nr:histidine phosphatase family protein [Candidatus Krumholzibacteria bacterium]
MGPLPRKIYLVRHAESAWNRERRVQGTALQVALSPMGRTQARLLGGRLRALPLEAVYSSDARRTLETARLALGEDVPLKVSAEIRELSLGEWEGRLIGDLRDADPEKLDAWYRRPSTVKIEGGEDLVRFRKRVVTFMDGSAASGVGDVAVITHGGVICIYLTHILGMHVDDLWSVSLPNASITTVVLDFKPRLRSFGDTSHLDGSALGLDGMPAPL